MYVLIELFEEKQVLKLNHLHCKNSQGWNAGKMKTGEVFE